MSYRNNRRIREAFGDPIGTYAGDPPAGARTQTAGVCSKCGMFAVQGSCGCSDEWPGTDSMPGMRMQRPKIAESFICEKCGFMPVEVGQLKEATCQCGMAQVQDVGGSTHNEEDLDEAEKGPSPKTAAKILKGTKTFKQKMKKVSGWADDPAAAAAWMTKRATGKWPREK